MDWQRPLTGRSSRTFRLAGLAVVALTLAIAAGFAVVPFAVRGLIHGLDLALDACVWLTESFEADADPWTVLAAIGRSAAGTFVTTRALTGIGILVLVSSLALYGLQRLLGVDEESRK